MMHRLRRLERLTIPPSASMPGIAIVIDDDDVPLNEVLEEENQGGAIRVFRAHPDFSDSDLRAALETKGVRTTTTGDAR